MAVKELLQSAFRTLNPETLNPKALPTTFYFQNSTNLPRFGTPSEHLGKHQVVRELLSKS